MTFLSKLKKYIESPKNIVTTIIRIKNTFLDKKNQYKSCFVSSDIIHFAVKIYDKADIVSKT